MSKKSEKTAEKKTATKKAEKKDKEIKVIAPEDPKEALKAALEAAMAALPEDQRAGVLKEMGLKQSKVKDQGPDPRVLFAAAAEKLGAQAVDVCIALTEFPGPVSATFMVDTEGVFSASVKWVRNKYGPRKSSD